VSRIESAGVSVVALDSTSVDRWAGSFGVAPPFALAVEEELLLIGSENELLEPG
jgi:hypothetical protein